MEREIAKKIIIINLHSVVDLITNSSTELFIVDTSKAEGILKELFDVILKNPAQETRIEKFEDYKYKNEYILPEGTDLSSVYICNIDQCDDTCMAIIQKFFTCVNFKYEG
jgi:hypothetical protein